MGDFGDSNQIHLSIFLLTFINFMKCIPKNPLRTRTGAKEPKNRAKAKKRNSNPLRLNKVPLCWVQDKAGLFCSNFGRLGI